jgi:hypothetical protein
VRRHSTIRGGKSPIYVPDEPARLHLQLAVVLAVCAVALAVCVALISTAELKASRPVALYGLGSGEEQDADNSIVTTFEVGQCP